jgi:hypothetical protein
MKTSSRIKLLLICSISLVTATSYAQDQPQRLHFPLMSKGWIGGDGAFSIALNDTTRLWLFGDTWVGQVKDNKRSDATIIRNSIATQGCDGQIHYYLRKGGQPFFINARKGEWCWPADGICINNTLYVFLSRVMMKDSTVTTGFGMANVGEDLAIIHLNSIDPADWEINYQPLPANTPRLASAVARDRYFVYLFGDDQSGRHTTFLARMPIDNITDFTKLQYYHPKTSEWKPEFNKATLLFGAAPEFSVRFDAGSQNWIAVYSKNGMSKDIMMRYAKNITGPWSNERVIAQCAEMQWSKNYYGYEAKQTAPLKGDKTDNLTITYLINSFSFWDVAKDIRIYEPQVIKVKNPLQ